VNTHDKEYKEFMKLFEPLTLKFEQANWARNFEFGLIDTILEEHSDLIRMTKEYITGRMRREAIWPERYTECGTDSLCGVVQGNKES
jgi:hypothetical protein